MSIREFFFGPQLSVEAAYEKAARLEGWGIEQTEAGYAVQGKDANGQPSTWQFEADQVAAMNGLLDHVGSCQIGDAYRQQRFGLAPGEEDSSPDWVERKHEIREYREKIYYKPGWQKLLGL